MSAFIDKQKQSLEERETLSYNVLRKNETGELQETVLKASVKKVEIRKKFTLSFSKDATPDQLALRRSWLSSK